VIWWCVRDFIPFPCHLKWNCTFCLVNYPNNARNFFCWSRSAIGHLRLFLLVHLCTRHLLGCGFFMSSKKLCPYVAILSPLHPCWTSLSDVLSVWHLPFSPLFSLWWKFYIYCSMIWSDVQPLVRYLAWLLLISYDLSACLEALSRWTNDDCYASEASRNHVFVYKNIPAFFIAATYFCCNC